MQNPEYVATKSAWSAVTILRVLFFWLIIPLIVMVVDIIIKKHEKIEFYEDCVIVKKGVLSKSERRTVFNGVYSVSIDQSMFGRICKYGNVKVDLPGKWDVNTESVANPEGLKNYLETRMLKRGDMQNTFAV